MKHTKKLLILLVIVFLLVGLGTLAATNNTQNNANIKKNTDTTHTHSIQDATKTQISKTQKQEKQIQKTIKNENKKQDIEPINIANYDELEQELNDDTTPTKILNITKNITLENNPTLNSSITKLTINGNYNTIDGDNLYTFLTINSEQSVIINNLRITQCHSSKGGAIHNREGTLKLINTTLTHNKATDGDGGAINNLRGNVTITNSNLDHNTAMQNGGAIFTQNGILTITKSNLTGNNATESYGSGGAIYNYLNGIVTITDSNITHNNANNTGGAIQNYRTNLTIINSNLDYNDANEGGAIYIRSDSNITITGSNLDHNTANQRGGAIYNFDGTCKISDTIFYNNLPANFILNDNDQIQLVKNDGFLTINDFTIITDNEIYHGTGQEALKQYTISDEALNVKLVLNGTNTKDTTFIIKGNGEKINISHVKITDKNPALGGTTNIIATFLVEDNPINDGTVIFRLNGKTLRKDNGELIFIEINEGIAELSNVKITEEWTKVNTTIQAICMGNNRIEHLFSDKINITVSKPKATVNFTAPETAQRGDTITLNASITSEGLPVNTGRVAFKLNGKTLKDVAGKALYVDVENGNAIIRYIIPAKTKAKKYTLTAVFSDNAFERCQKEREITIT